jgi:hypothetical protein
MKTRTGHKHVMFKDGYKSGHGKFLRLSLQIHNYIHVECVQSTKQAERHRHTRYIIHVGPIGRFTA